MSEIVLASAPIVPLVLFVSAVAIILAIVLSSSHDGPDDGPGAIAP